MLYYSPVSGNVHTQVISYQPKTCFLMTQLGDEQSPELVKMLKSIEDHLKSRGLKCRDATCRVTGNDFMDKIWEIAMSCPIGIAILTNDMSESTVSNIYYELGLFDALGRETVIVKSEDYEIPTDFVRTEYISYDEKFSFNFDKFIDEVVKRADHYGQMAELLEAKPLLTLDYLRRAYLITEDPLYRKKAEKIVESNDFDEHTKTILHGFTSHRP